MAYSYTLKQLVRRIAMLYLDDLKEGTTSSKASSNATLTFIDTSRYEKDDYFQSTTPVSWFRVYTTTDGLAPQGEEMDIVDWTLTNNTGILRSALSADIDSGDAYIILSKFRYNEIKEAINEAIDIAKHKFLKEKLTETTLLRGDIYDYDIPTGFLYIYRLMIQDTDGNFTQEIAPSDYVITRGASTPQIRFLKMQDAIKFEGHYYTGHWADINPSPNKIVLEDCDQVWSELVDGDVTAEADTSDYKVGSGALKLTVADACAAGDILATENIPSVDLKGRTYIGLWVKTSVALGAGDLQVLLDDTAQCASPLETLNIPATSADTWTYHSLALANPSQDIAITSVGIKMAVDKGAFTLRVDDIGAPSVLRIEGLEAQTALSSDSDTCAIDPDFVCAYATYRLLMKRGNRSDIDPENKASKAVLYKAEADNTLRTRKTTLPPNSRRVEV